MARATNALTAEIQWVAAKRRIFKTFHKIKQAAKK
jgi:hypothetical protein